MPATPTIEDVTLEYQDALRRVCRCRLRLFRHASLTVALATDESNRHACNSVTNTVEEIATAVCAQFGADPARLILIEHYDDREWRAQMRARHRRVVTPMSRDHGETFDLVKLRWDSTRFGEPDWERITKAQAEAFAGSPLP